jgi:hypothetical protein
MTENEVIKEMARKLFDLTLKIESLEREVKNYESQNKRFAPLDKQIGVLAKCHELYEICKEYLYILM